MHERLQKILADGGIGSRRECETLIQEGRVEVNRAIITRLGTKVDPARDSIRVDGVQLKIPSRLVFAVNKPKGVVSTSRDPDGRMRVIDLIPTDHRVYNVGRLDKESEGLIVVTNDGSLANRLTHPSFGVEKTYWIQVQGHPTREQMELLQKGVRLADGFAKIKDFRFRKKQKTTTEIEIILDEGRNREIRRLLASIGHKVLILRRIGIGAFFNTDIPVGGFRQLTPDEVNLFFKKPKPSKPKASRRRTPQSKSTQSRSSEPTTRKQAKKKSAAQPPRTHKPKKKSSAPKKKKKFSTNSKKKNVGRSRSKDSVASAKTKGKKSKKSTGKSNKSKSIATQSKRSAKGKSKRRR